jgi:23S rRNA A2030 N6-methylase RlmJ
MYKRKRKNKRFGGNISILWMPYSPHSVMDEIVMMVEKATNRKILMYANFILPWENKQ